jgi:hypothetical protein
MSTNKKIVLPEHIEKLLVGLNSHASAEKLEEIMAKAAEQIEKNKKLMTQLKDVPFSQTRAYTTVDTVSSTDYILSGTNFGYIGYRDRLKGSADNSFAQFLADYYPPPGVPQSAFALCTMTAAEEGTLWVVAKMGPGNASTGNYVSVVGSYDQSTWYYIGDAKVTQPNNASNGYNYVIGSVPDFPYYLVGTAAMGGANPDSNILVDAMGVTY